jgi:trehalose synthase
MTDEAKDWYRDAVVYELHVRAFSDGNGDGVGDFKGLIGRLPYIRSLGVTCIWLLPFYPSPLRDDGYDIADYDAVHSDYGDMADFRKFLKEAHALGMKVITELVINHTSDQHPWFKRARSAPKGSSARNWYVWSDTPDRWPEARIIFTDTESSNWTWDAQAGQYYWHRFFGHQPDLNFDHPPVRRAIEKVMRRWLEMGVDGMRLDAIPYLFERDGTNGENLPETHEFIKHLRRVMDEYAPPRLFLAEANQWPEDACAYFGAGDECHMTYHFPLMPRLFMALAQEDRHPIVEIMRRTPEIPEGCQWALFLRNHDELTLEMVTDAERDYMLGAYAANPRMRINVGIRRRLSPLLDNSRPRIELLKSILLSMPGTPVLYYGDEIGMGDNIYLGDRNGVRTPMQWSGDRNAGFSACDFSRLYAPPILDPIYHYAAVNVEAQERDPSSLLAWTRRMMKLRNSARIFGRAAIRFLEPSNRRILAYLRRTESTTILVVANLSRHPQPFALDLSEFHGMVPVEMQGGTPFPQIGKAPWPLSLGPWGWMWFRLRSSRSPAKRTLADLPLLEQEGKDAWWKDRQVRIQFLSSVLPGWLPGSVWIDAIGGGVVESLRAFHLDPVRESTVLATFDVVFSEAVPRTIRLPFTAIAEEEAEAVLASLPHAAVCRIRRPDGKIAVVVESLACATGPLDLQYAMDDGAASALEFSVPSPIPPNGLGSAVSALGKHHIAGLPGGAVLKWYHEGGFAPERSARLLALLEERRFVRGPRLLGTVRSSLGNELCGLLLERIEHQGRLDEKFSHERATFLEATRFGTQTREQAILPSLELCRELALAVVELDHALDDGAVWTAARRNQFAGGLRDLFARGAKSAAPKGGIRAMREQFWNRAVELVDRVPDASWKGEAHGDLHLGQILVRDGRMVFLDFDGNTFDPETPLPSIFDAACAAWSLWRLAHGRSEPEEEEAKEYWFAGCLREFLAGIPQVEACPELFELMLLRRWAEDLVYRPRHLSPDIPLGFLEKRLAWPWAERSGSRGPGGRRRTPEGGTAS